MKRMASPRSTLARPATPSASRLALTAPGERFESERTGAREEVEHPRMVEPIAQDAHPCLPHPVRGGTDPRIRGKHQSPAAEFAGDDPGHPRPPVVPDRWGMRERIRAWRVDRP